MNVITTTDVIYEGRMYATGHKFVGLSDEQTASLIEQGVARKATRTVEVDDDEQVEVKPAKAPAKVAAAPVQTDSDKQVSAQNETPKFNKDMNRDTLDEIAVQIGMGEESLEKYEKKAELVEAMKAHLAPSAVEEVVNG